MSNKEITKHKPEDVIRGNRLIGEFMGLIFTDEYTFKKKIDGREFDRGVLGYFSHWDALMPVVDKLSDLGLHVTISNHSTSACWWHDKKTGRFDAINGKYYNRAVGSAGNLCEKINVATKIEATYNVVVYFLEWYSFNREWYKQKVKQNKK